MTSLEASLFRAGIRGAQCCVFIAVTLGFFQHWRLGLLLIPVALLVIWAWQVLYENLP